MRKCVLLFLIIMVSVAVFSQDSKKNIYSGGMLFYQPGFTISKTNYQTLKDNSNSIGGILRFYMADYLTAGIYGGSQRTNYPTSGSENSYLSVGYGGPFIGLSHKSGKFRYTLSGFGGMGTVKNLHIVSQSANTLSQAFFSSTSAFVYSPLISLDYALTPKISFTIQGIYLVAKYEKKRLYNPTLQFGILFNR